MPLCQGCRRAAVRCDGQLVDVVGFLGTKLLSVAVNYQCCIAPLFQEYLFCLFMAMVSCRCRVFNLTLSPSSVSVALHIN